VIKEEKLHFVSGRTPPVMSRSNGSPMWTQRIVSCKLLCKPVNRCSYGRDTGMRASQQS